MFAPVMMMERPISVPMVLMIVAGTNMLMTPQTISRIPLLLRRDFVDGLIVLIGQSILFLYDRWRYHYPDFDDTRIHAAVPSEEPIKIKRGQKPRAKE